ncbi:hypothetical protein BDZ45DRAFT_806643 [Acephala macrosclerotiorum]|nr:hypothetical protein BDZ45DRAFT_806643 [Acephala macrosclerotiorum]
MPRDRIIRMSNSIMRTLLCIHEIHESLIPNSGTAVRIDVAGLAGDAEIGSGDGGHYSAEAIAYEDEGVGGVGGYRGCDSGDGGVAKVFPGVLESFVEFAAGDEGTATVLRGARRLDCVGGWKGGTVAASYCCADKICVVFQYAAAAAAYWVKSFMLLRMTAVTTVEVAVMDVSWRNKMGHGGVAPLFSSIMVAFRPSMIGDAETEPERVARAKCEGLERFTLLSSARKRMTRGAVKPKGRTRNE